MDISTIPILALKDNYIWTIINPHHRCALIVDPGEALPVIQYFKQHHLTLSGILITHHHWDHTNGIAELMQWQQVPIFAKQQSIATTPVQEGDRITINPFLPTFQVMEIPGHTLDHLAFYDEESLFSGDTLFSAGCGRIFEGDAKQMYHSLQKMAALSDQTKIYCGHEYTQNNLRFANEVEPENKIIHQRLQSVKKMIEEGLPTLPSTLQDEKSTNPFLRCEIESIIAKMQDKMGRQLSNPIEVFAALREWKDNF